MAKELRAAGLDTRYAFGKVAFTGSRALLTARPPERSQLPREPCLQTLTDGMSLSVSFHAAPSSRFYVIPSGRFHV